MVPFVASSGVNANDDVDSFETDNRREVAKME
jgi:hypothetical protein